MQLVYGKDGCVASCAEADGMNRRGVFPNIIIGKVWRVNWYIECTCRTLCKELYTYTFRNQKTY